MGQNHEANMVLTSGEIGFLWQTYQYESLANCGLQYFLQHVDDKDIKKVMEKALKLTVKRIAKVKELLTTEEHSIPEGFTEGDVNLKAPRLFSDELYLDYLMHTMQMEFFNYSWPMVVAVKWPIQQYYEEIMKDTMQLEMEVKELAKQKGVFIREPNIPNVRSISYVKKDSFLTGWFGNRRPLMALEISQLVHNTQRNALGEAVITAFSQVATSKKVKEFFKKGRDISNKHVQKFTEKLGEDHLPSGALRKTDQVTTSAESPFSERLMMNFITTLIASGIGEYGTAISMSPRHDLGALYARLMTEIAAYSNEGAKIMIDNAWMEQPPMAADRKNLSDNKSIK